MEENNFNQNLNTVQSDVTQEEVAKKPVGPIIGIAIIVVILIFGGLYYWGAQISKQDANVEQESLTTEQIENQEDQIIEQLQIQNTSDNVADIEADLNATDLENIDQDLENIDLEFSL
jgi:uncharacterized protein HemX